MKVEGKQREKKRNRWEEKKKQKWRIQIQIAN
jgi:hypothetical protein